MKNRELIDLMSDNQFEMYKEKLSRICHNIGLRVGVNIFVEGDSLKVEFKTEGKEFNPLLKYNYGEIVEGSKRYNIGYSRLKYIEELGYIKDKKIDYRYEKHKNILIIKLPIQLNNMQEKYKLKIDFDFKEGNFNIFSKNKIPSELSILKQFIDIYDYMDFIQEYFYNCIMHNNEYSPLAVKELCQYVGDNTTDADIEKEFINGKDRIIVDTDNIKKVRQVARKLGITKYYIYLKETPDKREFKRRLNIPRKPIERQSINTFIQGNHIDKQIFES